jgi:hypothetical protein
MLGWQRKWEHILKADRTATGNVPDSVETRLTAITRCTLRSHSVRHKSCAAIVLFLQRSQRLP